MADDSGNTTCGMSSCEIVCPANVTSFQEAFNCQDGLQDGVVHLKFMTGTFGSFIEAAAEKFNSVRRDVTVEIVLVSMPEMSPNIINEATSKTGLFDGFITPPGVMGSIVAEDGWADLQPFIEETIERTQDWSDILLSYRQSIAQFQDQILMYPLDGDVISLYYRKDVLEYFKLGVPRTWEEYNAVAKAVHGKEFKNQTLSGSCVGRGLGCAGSYWANLVLSSMTQTAGNGYGHLFDTKNMRPLLGEALLQALEWMEEQVKYGPNDEFSDCVAINDRMNEGLCALTYSWGNLFSSHLRDGYVFRQPGYELGITRTPGSSMVLDRDSMKLVPCDAQRCHLGQYYDDIGWVNHAPYLAFGGWSCAVNNYTTPGRKRLAMEFCAFTASREESKLRVIKNATIAPDGSDPFRSSHLNMGEWLDQGYEPASTSEYFANIQESLTSVNCVTDIRFPSGSEIYAVLDQEFHDHLNASRHQKGQIPDSRRQEARKGVCDRLQDKWTEIIQKYDQQTSSRESTLLQYQKLRNVYTVEVEKNQLGTGIISYGWSLTSLTMLAALACGLWTYRNRTTSVVRASQPLFLILISGGVLVFSTSIIPMAIDDGQFSAQACDRACMAVPWLTSMGWSILFSALYAKIRRVNLVVQNVTNFKQVKVSERDVMTPFAILFSVNLILLLVWTCVDPLFWERISISPTESYGTCRADSDSATWKIILAILATLNGTALIGANVEAWKARKIDTEYGESSFIGLIMASILQVVLVGVPLSFLVQDNPTARFFVNSSMAFVVSMSVLSLLFLPKVITLHENISSTSTKGSKSSRGEPNTLRSQSISETAIIEDLKTRVKNLQAILQEAGIDGTAYIRQSGLDDFGINGSAFIHPSSLDDCGSSWKSSPDVLSSLSREVESLGRESSRFESLPPVAEEDDEDRTERSEIVEQPPVVPSGPSVTRSSISLWLHQKRNDVSSKYPSPVSVSIPVEGGATTSTEDTTSANEKTNESLRTRIEESMRAD